MFVSVKFIRFRLAMSQKDVRVLEVDADSESESEQSCESGYEYELEEDEGDEETEEQELESILGGKNTEDDSFDLGHEFSINNWCGCTAHKLQLCLRDVFEEKDSEMKLLRQRIFTLLGKFHHSHSATKDLADRAAKAIILPPDTRWSYIAITYERVVEIVNDINAVAIKHSWDVISSQDVASMKEAFAIVNPIRQFTDKLQSDAVPTLSLVLPGLMSLIEALGKGTGLPNVRQNLIGRIRIRFGDILRSGEPLSDPIYIAAAVVDPCVAYRVKDKREEAKMALKKLIAQYGVQQEGDVTEDGTESMEVEQSEFGFEVAEPARPSIQLSGVDEEITSYLTLVLRNKVCSNGYQFWLGDEAKKFPRLSKIYSRILSIPATTAAVERLFSQVTLQTVGHRSKTGLATLKRRVLLKFNREFIVV